MTQPRPIIVAGETSVPLAQDIASILQSRFVNVAGKTFSDGEIKRAIDGNVRGYHTVVVASAAGDPNKNEKETRLLLRAAYKRGGAKEVTLLLPYMWYGRSDDPFDERAEPALVDTIESMRDYCHNVIVVDPHNAQLTRETFMGARNVKTALVAHLAYPYAVQLRDMVNRGFTSVDNLHLAHADAGSFKRISQTFRRCAYGTIGMTDRNPAENDWGIGLKDRNKVTGKSTYNGFSSEVRGKDVVVFEDMIASGGTAIELADLLKSKGARSVILFATSGLFTPKNPTDDPTTAINKLNSSKLDAVFITDTYSHALTNPALQAAVDASPVIHTVRTAPYLAGIIDALHADASEQDVDANSVSSILSGVHAQQANFGSPSPYKPGFPFLRLKAA